MATNTTARGEFSMGWKVLLAALNGVACGASPLPFNTIGFVLEPINKEFGWGGMYPVVALLPLLVALPIAFFFFREPRRDEMPTEIRAGGDAAGFSLGEAIKMPRFWIIFISIMCVSLAYGGAHLHMPEIIKQHGMGVEEGASIMGMIGVALFAGRIITGFLLDRFWAPLVCLPILLIPALACYMLMGTSTNVPMIYAAAFMLGFAAGAESDLIAYLASRYFGMANYGKIYGMLYLPFGVCASISPVIYGIVRDSTGSYDNALFGAMFLFAIGAVLLLFLGKYPVFSKAEESPANTAPA